MKALSKHLEIQNMYIVFFEMHILLNDEFLFVFTQNRTNTKPGA